jgi:hypothetical protein
VGYVCAKYAPTDLKAAGATVLLPLAAVLVGLTFAWGGNAQALLQSEAIEGLAEHRAGGLYEYVYPYQAAILVILVDAIAWGLCGLGYADAVWPTRSNTTLYFRTAWAVYGFTSLTIQECWQTVLSSQWLLLGRWEVLRRLRADQSSSDRESQK